MIVTDTTHELRMILTHDLGSKILGYKVAYGGLLEGYWLDGLESWRGSYALIAGNYGDDRQDAFTASEVVGELTDYFKGKALHGYKGGEYQAYMSYPLYVANYGDTMPNHLYNTGMEGYAGVVGLELDHEHETVKLIVKDVDF